MSDTEPVVSLDNVVVEYGRNRALNGVTASFGAGPWACWDRTAPARAR